LGAEEKQHSLKSLVDPDILPLKKGQKIKKGTVEALHQINGEGHFRSTIVLRKLPKGFFSQIGPTLEGGKRKKKNRAGFAQGGKKKEGKGA